MSKWDKLLNKICTLSNDIRFDEITKIMIYYGYTIHAPKGGSSHYTFRKPGCAPITIPKHGPIKKAYVKLIKEIIENEEEQNENHQ